MSLCSLQGNGECPLLRGVGLDAGAQEEAGLRTRQFSGGRIAEGEQGLTALGDEAGHNLVHWLLAGRGLSVPEILRGRIRGEVGGEIGVNAFSEGLLAEVVLNSEQDVAGLPVGNAIKYLFDLLGGVGAGSNGAGGGKRVEIERVFLVGGDN